MKNVLEFAAYVEKPELLAKLCVDVIKQIDDQQSKAELEEIESQLKEIAYAIDKLEKTGTSVPDELRQLKTGLAAKLVVREKIIGRLKPFEEMLDGVLRDLRLRIGKTKGSNYRRFSSEHSTSREVMRTEIIRALQLLGGAGSPAEVKAEIEKNIGEQMLQGDKVKLNGGRLSWHKKCEKERKHMIKDGILKSDSPTGLWELSGKKP
jgi:hypothetical protein